MHFSLLPIISHLFSLCTAVLIPKQTCTADQRIDLAKQTVINMQLPTAIDSALAYTQYPFSSDMHIIINPNNLGPIPLSIDRTTTLAVLAALYEVVYKVNPRGGEVYGDIDEKTTFFNITVALAVAHYIPIPAEVYFELNLTFIIDTCELRAADVKARVPSALLGYGLDVLGLEGLLLD